MTGKIFVNMTDKFLSGWGKASRGRSLYCIECDTLEQAKAVEKAAQDRPEMKYVTIAASPRRARPGDHLRIVRFENLGGPWLYYYGPARNARNAS